MSEGAPKKLVIPGPYAERYGEVVPWSGGSEAEVYRAERRHPAGVVALKVLVPQGTRGQRERRWSVPRS